MIRCREVVLKNYNFRFGKKTLKEKRGTAIGKKFLLFYSILFMAELEEEILEKQNLNCIYGESILLIHFALGAWRRKTKNLYR